MRFVVQCVPRGCLCHLVFRRHFYQDRVREAMQATHVRGHQLCTSHVREAILTAQFPDLSNFGIVVQKRRAQSNGSCKSFGSIVVSMGNGLIQLAWKWPEIMMANHWDQWFGQIFENVGSIYVRGNRSPTTS